MIFEIGVLAIIVILLALLWLRRPSASRRAATAKTAHKTTTSPMNPAAAQRAMASAGAAEAASAASASADEPGAPRETPAPLLALRIITRDDLDAGAQAQVEAICRAMPEPHPVQKHMAGGLDTPEELLDAVVTDAGLTAAILRTVNSAAFALATPITSVQHAINYLGVGMVKGLVAQSVVAENTLEGTPEQQAALARVWRSACSASAFAQLLGQELGLSRPSVLSTKSLFFNLGDVALVLGVDGATQWYEEGISIVARIEAQQAACGANTAIVGAELARLWKLPPDLVAAIETGFLPLNTPAAEHPMSGEERQANIIVFLAGRIGDRISYRALRDIAELPLGSEDEPGLFFLPEHLSSAGLGRAPGLLQSPAFRRKANKLISTLAP
ncbi:MAG: HDOD domain-containing protein [Halieaceae bacterium]|jgi:HD-like signal output (HDOD) protein|nr:HDOD domain-containing protein [Halieaceae bacterium]